MVGKYVLFVAIETAALKNTSKKWIRVGETKKMFFEEVNGLIDLCYTLQISNFTFNCDTIIAYHKNNDH